MIRLLALALLVGMALPLSAQTPTHLYDNESIEKKVEFIQNLRRKGYVPLARDFTDQLIKTAKQEEHLLLLKLEQARTVVALAKEEGPEQRMKLIGQARELFAPFLKSNPNSPAGAQARMEMARLFSMQAMLRLNRASAEEDPEIRAKGAKEARDLYDAANDEFEAAIKVFKDTNQKNEEVYGEFDRALNFVAKASAFIEPNENRQRALTVHNATLIFDKFAKDKESETGLLANAYLVKCYQEEDSPDKVNEHMIIVDGAKGPSAAKAQKLALYYAILYEKTRPKSDPAKSVIDRSNLWLQRFPTAKKSFEGEHLRYEQALGYLTLASRKTDGFKKEKYDKLKTNLKEKTDFETNLNNADKLAKELAAENGDFSERAKGLHSQVERIRILLEPSKSRASFDAALMNAKIRFSDAAAAKEPDASKIFRQGQDLLRVAITVGETEGVQPGKMHEAQYMLGQAYLSVNDGRRAAISFDALARATPPSKKGAEGAAQAIHLYKQFIEQENDEIARDLLFDLGDYVLRPDMKKLWGGDPIIGIALYTLAMDLYARDKHKEALDHLAKMPKDSLGYAYAQSQAVFIALAGRQNADADKRKAWTEAAKAALARLGPLPPGADGTTTLLWHSASLKGPEILYAEGAELLRANKIPEAEACYVGMAKMIAGIEAVFAKAGDRLAKDKKDKVGLAIQVLKKYSHLGAAEIEYRKGDYAKVGQWLGPVVAEVQKGDTNPKADILVPDIDVVGESINLVLRALIQLSDLDRAQNAYSLLIRIKPAGGEAHDSARFTRALIKDLSEQYEDMKSKKDAKFHATVARFEVFGDVMAKSLVYNAKPPKLPDIINMAKFFASLERFKKAADLFEVVPKPKFLDQPGLKATAEQENELYDYWDSQLEYGNMLRKSQDWAGANKLYNSIINHPNGRKQVFARKEKIHMYEDMGQFGTAQNQWVEFMKPLAKADLANNKTIQNLYFEAYYSKVVCLYKHSQSAKKDSDSYLNQAASQIVQLEFARDSTGWQLVGPKFVDFMEKEKKLKEAYEVAKSKRK